MENQKSNNYLLVIAIIFLILGLLRIVGGQRKGPCFENECLSLRPKNEKHTYNPYIANIGKPDNYNRWEMNKRYCFKNTKGKETSCLDIYEEFGNRSVDLVINGGYYCNTSNNRQNYECHINGSQVPDIQYDKNGQPTAYICTPKGTYEDSTGDCKELRRTKACKTALCSHDSFSDSWSTQGDEASQWMYNFARCQWMRYNKTDHLDKKCSSLYNIP